MPRRPKNNPIIVRAIEYFDNSPAQLARALNVAPSFISQMKNWRRPIPPEMCVPLENLTEGEIQCEEMRPNVFRDRPYKR